MSAIPSQSQNEERNDLGDLQRFQVLATQNGVPRDYPHDRCLHQLFEAQVRRMPDAEAIRCNGQSLTYGELNHRANNLAHRLQQLGVEPDVVVGLCVERSLDMMVGILGILKSGGAYLPLDPTHPPDRLATILEDNQTATLVTHGRLTDALPGNHFQRVLLDDACVAQYDDNDLARHATSRNLAYVMYTSGSTGRPKGVCIEHRAVANFIHAMLERPGIDSRDRVLALTTVGFDISVLELLLPLTVGAQVVIASDAQRLDMPTLAATLQSEQISVMQSTPVTWRALIASGWAGDPHIKALCGGEALPAELAREIAQRCDSAWNLYGPTETTVWSTVKRLEPDGPVTIGRPIANTHIYILDDGGKPVPVGTTGEIYIGGEGLARGYWNRPELTAERFLPDPFDPTPGARMYRTGDLARWREDGDIEYLGRADQQVKIRGFRIELEEIEAVLEKHPDVAQCAVVVQTDVTDDKQLVAFLVPRAHATLVVQELRVWLAAKLPSYMIPARYATLDALPLTPNGKLDRQALECLEIQVLPTNSEFVAPRNELERGLAQIWQEVLRHREPIGIHDHFLDLGGHSLLAMRIVSQLASRLAIHVPVRWVLEYPTIAELAAQIESTDGDLQGAESIPCVSRQETLPMSFGQQRFWILQETLPDPATYNVPFVHRITGAVDADLLQSCLRALVDLHEALRTALIQDGDSLRQKVVPIGSLPLPWREADWRTLTVEEQAAALREEVRRPFDLSQAPLWRVLWSEVGPDEHMLALTFHHSIVDEWSLRLFFQELEQLYTAGGNAEQAGLAALPVQYADYAVWQRQQLTDERRQRDAAYWAEQLAAPPPPLPLPADSSRPDRDTHQGAVHRFALSQEVVNELRRLARAEGISLFTLMLAAYQVWLSRYSGQDDVIIATPVADREHDDLHGVFGYFLNTVPIRTRLARQASFREVLVQVRQTVMAGLEHGGLPFEEIVNAAGPAESGSRTPLHQVMFVLLEEGIGSWQLGRGGESCDAVGSDEERCFRGANGDEGNGVVAEARYFRGAKGDFAKANVVHGVHTGTSKCDLLLSIGPEGDKWFCELEYATDLFSAYSAQRMAAHWQELLVAIVADPDQRIASLNLMPESERRQVIETWNDTQRTYPHEACVHTWFEAQVAETPEAVAVSCEGQVLTYRELNQRANRLAHFLQNRNVDTGTCVGVYLRRSIDFVVSVLAILKAGGTYVPLAQNCPVERLRFKMSDSGAAAIITNSTLPDELCDAHVAVVDLQLEAAAIRACSDQPVKSQAKATDPAYVMYTSGSTGRPKGVAVPHRGIVRLVCSGDYVNFASPQRFLLLAPTSFDASTFELWGPLLHGNQCVIYPQPLPDLEDLEQAVRSNEITCLWLTAGLFNQIIDQRPSLLETVPHVLTGGEALSVAHVKRALELYPHLRLTNGYGPTECTTFACTYDIDPSDTFPTGSVPIGRPIANTQCYVLDDEGAPVPVGVAGELYLGGDGLACGYLNLPELTAERFVPHPFSDEPAARLYRTGDFVRYNADGLLEFLGRRDQQFKIRGFRVELGEIEAVLETHPDIAACAVVVQESDTGDKQLVAWLVLRKPAQLTGHDLRGWLETRLPHYMLPARYSVVDALPLTPNGKVDRKTLSAHPGQPLESGVEYIAPSSNVERVLVKIWRDVLRCESIGVNDHFFELGGNSLTAVQVIGRIQATLGVLVPVADLFAHPTLGRFADQVLGHMTAGARYAASDGQQNDLSPPIFLLQWYLDLTDFKLDGRKCYVLPFPDISDTQEHCCVEYVATKCMETLRTVQPKGPYHLIGFSLAGLVAHEMTRRLRDAGEEVAFVAIIDTLPATLRQRMTIQLIAWLGKLFHTPFPKQVAYTRRALAWCRSVASFPVRCARSVVQAVGGRPSPTAVDVVAGVEEASSKPRITAGTENPISGYSSWAYCAFAPQRAKGAMYLLSTEELVAQCSEPGRYWRRFVEELEERVVPGKHLTCIREHKPALVETLRACLGDEISKIRKGSEG